MLLPRNRTEDCADHIYQELNWRQGLGQGSRGQETKVGVRSAAELDDGIPELLRRQPAHLWRPHKPFIIPNHPLNCITAWKNNLLSFIHQRHRKSLIGRCAHQDALKLTGTLATAAQGGLHIYATSKRSCAVNQAAKWLRKETSPPDW